MQQNKMERAIAHLTQTFIKHGTLFQVRGENFLDLKEEADIEKLLDVYPYNGSHIGQATSIDLIGISSYILQAATGSKNNNRISADDLSIDRIILGIRDLISALSYHELGKAAAKFIIYYNGQGKCISEHRFVDGFKSLEDAHEKNVMQTHIESWLSLLKMTCRRRDVEACKHALILLEDQSEFRDALVDEMTNLVAAVFDFIDNYCEPTY